MWLHLQGDIFQWNTYKGEKTNIYIVDKGNYKINKKIIQDPEQ